MEQRRRISFDEGEVLWARFQQGRRRKKPAVSGVEMEKKCDGKVRFQLVSGVNKAG